MRNARIVLLLVASVLLLGIIALAADDEATSLITVKSSAKSSGVVTLQIAKDTKTLELTCNLNMPSCVDLKKGNYRMLELPKNHGMYDCRDVRVFAESGTSTEDDDKLGEYCLADK